MIDDAIVRKAVQILRESADPVKIILFGSYARGDASDESDVDFLVIERAVANRHDEMVRLLRALSPLRVPADVLVVSDHDFTEWSDTPGNIFFEAATDGKVVYEVP